MLKIAFVGAGSLGFTRTLVIDLMSYKELENSTISLIDIDPERLDYAKRAVERIMEVGKYPAKVEASVDRAVGLKDADIVIISILADGVEGFRPEIEIPMKYGVDFNVGDSYGTAAVFRSLRTIPQMLAIARDIEKYAPHAFILNYTNPMQMLCRALTKVTSVRMVGLCHSVQGLAGELAKWIDVPGEEVVWEAGGINHQAWLLRFEHKGEDLYPRLRKAVEKPEIWEKDIVRNEMFKALGYYVTESSGHNSEYSWWFRKRPDLIEKYCTHGKDWNSGVHAFILKRYAEAAENWREQLAKYAEGKVEIKLGRSHEYASAIVLGLLENKTFKFYGNIPNTDLITNLPDQCVVEVPIIADKTGFNGIHVGALPPQLVALNHITVMVSELTVQAALNGDPVAAYQACCYDPLAAAKLSLAEIKEMVDELFKVQAPLLPQFKHLN